MLKYQASVDIAGIVFEIRANEPGHLKWLQEQCAKYIVDKEPDVRISLYPNRVNPLSYGKLLFSGPYNVYGDIDKNLEFKVYSKKKYIALGDLLRFLTGVILIKQGGILLHSCGVVMDGGAYCLAGPSGSGKTTVAGLAEEGTTLLSDETTAVTKNHRRYFACATPFFGGFGRVTSGEKAGLRGILFLKQARHFRHKELKPAIANMKLIQNIFLLGKGPCFNMEMLFGLVSDITKAVPCYEIEFLPEKNIWKYIREEIFPGA